MPLNKKISVPTPATLNSKFNTRKKTQLPIAHVFPPDPRPTWISDDIWAYNAWEYIDALTKYKVAMECIYTCFAMNDGDFPLPFSMPEKINGLWALPAQQGDFFLIEGK